MMSLADSALDAGMEFTWLRCLGLGKLQSPRAVHAAFFPACIRRKLRSPHFINSPSIVNANRAGQCPELSTWSDVTQLLAVSLHGRWQS